MSDSNKPVYGIWTVACRYCQLRHGPVGNLQSHRDSVLRRYYCPKANRTVFLKDNLQYFGEVIGVPTGSLKKGFRHAIMVAQGMIKSGGDDYE